MSTQAQFDPVPGSAERLRPGLRRILAPNPSPMTYRGTNTYVLGEGCVAVIDPGPAIPGHLRAIQNALKKGERVTHILVTHSHRDHSPLAAPLSAATGAPVMAFGDSRSGRSKVMQALAEGGMTGGGEGLDRDFQPHERLADGAMVEVGEIRLTALWTPGHLGNHLCFAWDDAVFTGDHVMGWASSLVSPPDGDLSDFMASTEKLAARRDRVHYPGHGAPINDPAGRLDWLLGHRRAREAQILARLGREGISITSLTRDIYTDISPALLPAAERNVLAHLIDLHGRNKVMADPKLSRSARFSRAA